MSAAPRQHDHRTSLGRLLASAAVVLAVAVAVACAGPGGDFNPGGDGQGQQGEGPGHREQPLALTPAQELRLGQQAYREVLEEEDHVLPQDDPAVRRVRRVGERIVEAAHIEPLEREINLHVDWRYYEWEFNVLRSRKVNAFCLPGGKVAVYSALLKVTGDNDSQLATVLSHEIAHALAHHSSERLARERNEGRSLGSLSFQRWQESEADHIGVFLMTFAGYDPDQAVAFWERMEEMTGGSGVPEVLSDHPSDERRIRQLQGWARMAAAAYKAYKSGRVAPAGRG
jgi:metalloendopeptidase OMA1, mitochondrial